MFLIEKKRQLQNKMQSYDIKLNELQQQLDAVRFQLQQVQFQLQCEQLRQRGIASRLLLNRLNSLDALKYPPYPEVDQSRIMTINEYFEWLNNKAPIAFKQWRHLFDVNCESYEGFPVNSCSVDGHAVSPLFRDFISLYLYGNILDIGCGPQPLPNYLEGYSLDRIYGLDPIVSQTPKAIHFHHGIAEYTPWLDNSFNTVVIATSLDHVLLLEETLLEIKRILAPAGWLLLWVHFSPGASEYNPYDPNIQPIDQYHLFHFDKSWFESLLIENFSLGEAIHLENFGTYRGSFYAFQVCK